MEGSIETGAGEDYAQGIAREQDAGSIYGGMLSRTVIESPRIKAAFQADVRFNNQHDIILVGETWVKLQTFDRNGRTKTIYSITNLESNIIAAQLLNSHAKQVELSHPASPKPKDVLILMLESFEIVLIVFEEREGRITASIRHQASFPLQRLPIRDANVKIIVDPKSRTIATVGTFEALIVVQLAQGHNWLDPVTESKFSVVESKVDDMIIWLAGFLMPPQEDPDAVYLAVFGMCKDKFVMVIISWDSAASVNSQRSFQQKRQTLSNDQRFPLMVIPLQKVPGSFLLIYDKFIEVYVNAHDNCVQLIQTLNCEAIHMSVQPKVEFASTPLWVAWSRSAIKHHSEELSLDPEHLYLAREDGFIARFLVSRNSRNAQITNIDAVATLNQSIDTAFIVVDLSQKDQSTQEAFFVGGDSSDGGLYIAPVSPKPLVADQLEDLGAIQGDVVDNWSPITDACVIQGRKKSNLDNIDISPYNSHPAQRASDRIFLTSGKSPSGSICELQVGYGLEIVNKVIVSELSNISKNFCFKLGFSDTFSVLVSFPYQTLFILDPFNAEDLDSYIISEDQPTLAAARCTCTPDQDSILAIHPAEAKFIHFVLDENGPSIYGTKFGETFSVAAIEPISHVVVLARSTPSGSKLVLKTWQESDGIYILETCKQEAFLDSEITCVSLFRVTHVLTNILSTCAVVGTVNGEIFIYQINDEDELKLCMKFELDEDIRGESPIPCESICITQSNDTDSNQSNFLLVCSRRDGSLEIFKISSVDIQEMHYEHMKTMSITISHGPTRVFVNRNRPNSVFILGESEAFHLEALDEEGYELKLGRLWITDCNDRSMKTGTISTFSLLEPDNLAESPCEEMLITVGSTMMITSMDIAERAVMRQISVLGSPNRITYLPLIKKLVIESTIFEAFDDGVSATRVPLATISLLDPNKGASFLDQSELSQTLVPDNPNIVYHPGQRVTCLVGWILRENDLTRQFIVTGTQNIKNSGRHSGSLVFLKVSSDLKIGYRIQKWRECEMAHPVYSICQMDNNGPLLYACGQFLMMRKHMGLRSSMDTQVYDFRSPCKSISTLGDYVYATTAQRALVILHLRRHFVEEENFQVETDSREKGDRSREGLSNRVLDVIGNVIVSDMNRTVSFFPRSNQSLENPGAEFEAWLPSSAIRFCVANMRHHVKDNDEAWLTQHKPLGIAADGSVFAFTVLNEATWRVFRFIQNLCIRDTRVCAISDQTALKDMHVEPDEIKKSMRHINGDILAKLAFRPDATALLNTMLDQDVVSREQESGMKDYDTAAMRRSRFTDHVNSMNKSYTGKRDRSIKLDMEPAHVAAVALRFLRAALESPF